MANDFSPTEDELSLAADALTEYEELADRYDELKQAAEEKVAEWVWFTGVGADPRPLEFERNGEPGPPGQRLDEKPDQTMGCALHGFDDSGRVLVTRQDRSLSPGEDEFDETVFTYHSDRTDIVERSHSGRFGFERLIGPIDRLDAWVQAGQGYAVLFRPRYDGDRLVRLDTIAGMEPGETPEHEASEHVSYDDDGRIAEVWRERADGERFREYPAPEEKSDDTAPPPGSDEMVSAFKASCDAELDSLTPRQALTAFTELLEQDAAGQAGYDFEFLLAEVTVGTEAGKRRLTWSLSQILSRPQEDDDQPNYFGFQCSIVYPYTDELTDVPVDAEECDPEDDDPATWLTEFATRPEIELLEAVEPLDVQISLHSHD